MMLTLLLVGRCQGCQQEVKGAEFLFPKRINLGSIVTERSMTFFDRKCGCDPNGPRHEMEVLSSKLTEESAEQIDKAHAKLRARRKRAA